MKKIIPLVITDDIQTAAKFHIDLFGFTVVYEADWYVHLLHEDSGSELAFMITNSENQPDFLHQSFTKGGLVLTFEVDNAAAEFERIAKLDGVTIKYNLKSEEWGQKHFIIEDPAGVYIDVVEQL